MRRPSYKSKFQSEYNALKNAIDRCTRTTHPQYADYGGRGITVDPEFTCPYTGFVTFIADVGAKPHSSLTLERKCNSLGYVKGNLVWASRSTQQQNRRPRSAKVKDLGWGLGCYSTVRRDGQRYTCKSALVPLGSRVQTIKTWSEELGVSGKTLTQRLQRGWSPEQALTSIIYNPSNAPKSH